MRSAIKQAMTVLMAAAGLAGCGNMDDLESAVGEDGAGSVGGAAEEVTTLSSALSFSECSTRIATRGNETAVRAVVGNLVSMHDLGNGARGEYSNGASIFCNGANGETKYVIGLIRQKYFFMGAQALGYPSTDELPNSFNTGRYNYFNWPNQLILWKSGAAEAFEIHGAILHRFGNLGSEDGMMGFATGDETAISGSRRRNIFEFGRIFWTSTGGAWPVMTSVGNPSNKLVEFNLARLTSVSMQADGLGGGCLRASGAGFTPGQTVMLRITNPNQILDQGSVVVASNGTFSFVDVPGNQTGQCAISSSIRKVNGFATAWAFELNTGKSAVAAFSTTAGGTFTGTM